MEGGSCIFNFTCDNIPAVHEESMYQRISRESSTLTGIRNFIKLCTNDLQSCLGLEQSFVKFFEGFKFVTQSVSRDKIEVKFLSRAYSFALAVQAWTKMDQKWKNVAKTAIEHPMSVDAPSFKPNFSAASVSPVRLPLLQPFESQEILKQNIAHMYKYYNDLIGRQNGGAHTHAARFQNPVLLKQE